MSDVLLRASSLAAPAVPRSRGPALRTPRDSVSEAYQPPRRPPSRSASRGRTPRTGNTTPPSTPKAPAMVPQTSSPDATAPAPPSGTGFPAGGNNNNNNNNNNNSNSRRGKASASRSATSLQFVIEDEGAAHTHTGSHIGDMDSIAFDIEPSTAAVEQSRQRSAAGTTEDFTFEVESSQRRRKSETTDDIQFHCGGTSAPSMNAGESIQFVLEPSQTRRSVAATEDFHFDVITSDVQTPVAVDDRASLMGDGGKPDGQQKLSIVREEPPTEAANGDDRSRKSGSSSGEASTKATLNETAAPRGERENGTSDAVAAAAAAVAAPTPPPPEAKASAPPVSEEEEEASLRTAETPAVKEKIERGGPTVIPAAPRREPTKPRQVEQKSREQLMNERPWRTATPPQQRQQSGKAKGSARARGSGTPVKTREELMNERPWQSPSPAGGRRASSPSWAPKKTAAEREREAAAARTVAPVKTRSELMRECPWRSATPASRAATPKKTKQQRRESVVSPVATAAASGPIPRRNRPTPAPHPAALSSRSSSSNSSFAMTPAPAPAADGTVKAPAVTTTPPVLLRSPWAVMAEEMQDWTDMVNQAASLRHILETMRAREREVARCTQRIASLEKEMKRIDKGLYRARDDLVNLRGVDVNGDPLQPEREQSKLSRSVGASRANSTAATAADDAVAARLYPFKSRQGPMYPLNGRARQLSVLSDDDLSDNEKELHAEELDEWRGERGELRATKVALLQRSKDLKYHLRRGTNIKDLSALTITSSRTPLERHRAGTSTRVDEYGYDVLAKLRIEASEAQFALDKAREAHKLAQGTGAVRRRQRNSRQEATQAQRDALKSDFGRLSHAFEDTIGRARSLSILAGSSDNINGHKAPPEEIDFEEGEEGGDGWRSPGVTAPGVDEITASETKRDITKLLQLHVRAAEESFASTKAHQKETLEAATARRSGRRSTSRPATARARSQATSK